MRMKCVHRKSRPIDWDTWGDEKKLAWLKRKKPKTLNILKEIDFIEKRQQFKGVASFVNHKREEERKEKYNSAYACRKRREVKSCKECLRYQECYENKPLDGNNDTLYAEIRLGHVITLSVEDAIRRCWEHGWKDQLKYWLKVLDSQRTNILTAETVDGHASAQAIVRLCQKKYGDFEPIYKATQDKYLPQLKAVEDKIAKRKKTVGGLDKLSKKANDIVAKLYGDTL